MTVKSAFLISIAIRALRKTARKLSRKSPGKPRKSEIDLWLVHSKTGFETYFASAADSFLADRVQSAVQPSLPPGFHIAQWPAKPPGCCGKPIGTFHLARWDFPSDIPGFNSHFIDDFNSRLDALEKK